MKFLLDTCVISELTRTKPESNVVEWMESREESSFFLSVVTLGELRKGVERLTEGRKKQELRRWIEHDLRRRFSGRIVIIDEEVACYWGQISGVAENRGRKVPVLDGLIAATALAHGMAVATRNIEHMKGLGVELVNPWRNTGCSF